MHLFSFGKLFWDLLFYCSYSKNEMVFLMSRSASKHVLFVLGVDPTARDASKGGGSDLVSLRPSQCRARVVAIHVPSLIDDIVWTYCIIYASLHKSSIAKPCKTSSKCCRVCH